MCQLLINSVEEVHVRTALHQHELLVEELEDARRASFLNHVDGVLVVLERNALPLDTLSLILLLLESEHVLVELLLQFLVRIINTELLKRVLCENLETEDVKQADERKLALLSALLNRPFRFLWLRRASTAGGLARLDRN